MTDGCLLQYFGRLVINDTCSSRLWLCVPSNITSKEELQSQNQTLYQQSLYWGCYFLRYATLAWLTLLNLFISHHFHQTFCPFMFVLAGQLHMKLANFQLEPANVRTATSRLPWCLVQLRNWYGLVRFQYSTYYKFLVLVRLTHYIM